MREQPLGGSGALSLASTLAARVEVQTAQIGFQLIDSASRFDGNKTCTTGYQKLNGCRLFSSKMNLTTSASH